eukprot:gene9990-10145_t
MGLLDNVGAGVSRLIAGTMLAALLAVFVAMCIKAPTGTESDGAVDLSVVDTGDTAWMLVSTALVLLMTPGLAFFYGGMISQKNVVSTIMQAMVLVAIIPILWSILGFALAFGGSVGSAGFFGNPMDYGLMYNVGAAPVSTLCGHIPLVVFFMYQMAFAVITPALIVGSISDSLWHLVLYCPLAHMAWHPSGIIRKTGVLDFAGGTVVHMSSGYAALVAAMYLGRSAKVEDPELSDDSNEPSNIPIVVLGTALLWFGWFGFNGGSALAANALAGQAFMNTNASAASAMLAWMLLDHVRGHKMRATGACIGAVIGLVSITPSAGFVNVGAAFIIGIIGSVICSGVQELMERYGRRYISDTLDVFACHGMGGTVGMVCSALFATKSVNPHGDDGIFYGNPMLLGKTLLVLVIIVPWIFAVTWGCLWITNCIVTLRVSDEEQVVGLDMSKHGERAVPRVPRVSHVVESYAESMSPRAGSVNGGSLNGARSANGGSHNGARSINGVSIKEGSLLNSPGRESRHRTESEAIRASAVVSDSLKPAAAAVPAIGL